MAVKGRMCARRASNLRGSAWTICTWDLFKKCGRPPARLIGCARLIQISMPYWPLNEPPANRNTSSAVLIPAGLLVSCNPMILIRNDFICSRRYCSLPAKPSGPTKSDPTLKEAKLKANWAEIFLLRTAACSCLGKVDGICGGVMSKPTLVRVGRPASRCVAIQRNGKNCAHLRRSICCRVSLCPWAASVLAKWSANSFHASPACPATCSTMSPSSVSPAARAWNTHRRRTNVAWLSWQLVQPEACSAVVLESVLKTVGMAQLIPSRHRPAQIPVMILVIKLYTTALSANWKTSMVNKPGYDGGRRGLLLPCKNPGSPNEIQFVDKVTLIGNSSAWLEFFRMNVELKSRVSGWCWGRWATRRMCWLVQIQQGNRGLLCVDTVQDALVSDHLIWNQADFPADVLHRAASQRAWKWWRFKFGFRPPWTKMSWTKMSWAKMATEHIYIYIYTYYYIKPISGSTGMVCYRVYRITVYHSFARICIMRLSLSWHVLCHQTRCFTAECENSRI